MAFDMVSETFRLVAPPPEPMKKSDDVLMFELDGALTLLKLDKKAGRLSPEWTLKLWVLLEDADGGERWACRHPALSKVSLVTYRFLELSPSGVLARHQSRRADLAGKLGWRGPPLCAVTTLAPSEPCASPRRERCSVG
ncbi:hypothetical protein E2562_004090 [Oryza meyeriana var. granulata]|uniref:Uncharacterized protein n=1 Tax=Oryza meyeriana var. granulata TaxID=110450 RepID=A0A6G1BJK3_9ORYZ|nr:hypothetical protein E2562_004090 [Oryza meyeriana var. granulata]